MCKSLLHNYKVFFLSLFITITISSCAQKQGTAQDDKASKKSKTLNEDDLERTFILPVGLNDDNSTGDCSKCDTKPGDLATFNAALKDAKVQRYTDGGETKIEYKMAETFCDPSFFSTCNDKLIIQASDQKSDRVELRQEKNLSLNAPAIMRFQAKFENLPNASKTKGVTLAQIHNDASGVGRPLLRVEYTGENELRVVVTDTYVKGAGTSKNDFMTSFRDGDELYCKLEMMPSDDQVRVYLKNMNTGKSASKTYTVNTTWKAKDGEFYFKTGAYLQESGKSPKATYKSLMFTY